jgi:cytochrome c biogenesis protein CcmG/thiol:disulfide interchange protein DsbE
MISLSPARWNMLLAATLIAGALFIAATRVAPGPATAQSPRTAVASEPAPRANHPAPDFALAGLDGAPVRLSELRGQVVLVNYWATWCGPCRAEMPMIQAAYDEYRERGFAVLAVNAREDRQTVAAYLAEGRLSFPALLDHDGAVGAAYQATVMPSSFFIDRAGVVRAVYKGPMSRAVIAGTVEQLLAEEP